MDAIAGQVWELLSHNVFAYYKNNPVNMSDKGGFRPIYTVGEETDEMVIASVAVATRAAAVQCPPLKKHKKDRSNDGVKIVGTAVGDKIKSRIPDALSIAFNREGAKHADSLYRIMLECILSLKNNEPNSYFLMHN